MLLTLQYVNIIIIYIINKIEKTPLWSVIKEVIVEEVNNLLKNSVADC